jgi:hypothetical protein
MQRYNKIYDKIPREILLLKSLPCIYSGKCSFCNYILDNSTDINEIRQVNDEFITMITGEFGVVEIINSGSVFELPTFVLETIREKVNALKVHTLYFEAFYAYHKRLDEMRKFFPHQEVRYRIGIETFDDEFRKKVLGKPFPTSNIIELSQKFYACCLLICVQGQTRQQIVRDIELARNYFKEITINVFVNNTTPIMRDEALVAWFAQEIYPTIRDENNIEILLDNKDQGVFVQ